MEFELTAEQRLIQDTVRAFVDERILPVAVQNDIDHRLDLDLIEGMAELGILGIVIPEEYGGAGLDFVAEALACEEIERGEAAFRTLISVHVGLNSLSLLRYGSEEQKQRWLVPQAHGDEARLLRADRARAPGRTSPRCARRRAARATSTSSTGRRTGSPTRRVADHALVFAKTDPEAGHKGITAFVLEKGMPGFTSARHRAQARDLGRLDRRALLRERRGAGGEPDRRGGPGVRGGDVLARPGPVHRRGRRVRRRARLPRALGRRTPASARHSASEIGRYQFVQDMIAKMVLGYETSKLLVMQAAWMKNVGQALDAGDVAREMACDRVGLRGGPPRDPGVRLVRLQRRVRDRAVFPQRARADHLRGDDPDPQADAGRARPRLPQPERRGGEVSPICSWAPALSPVHARG